MTRSIITSAQQFLGRLVHVVMDIQSKKYTRSVNFTFIIILLLGIGISALVFLRGEKITNITLDLVEHQIPTFELFEQFHSALIEQERYLYEFYASETEQLYHEGYVNNYEKASQYLGQLFGIFGELPQLLEAQAHLNNINSISSRFYLNIQSPQTDWDLARNQLAAISQARRDSLPYMQELRIMAQDSVNAAYANVESESYQVRAFVFIYGLVTLFIAFLVAKATKSAIANSAMSQRLALFPRRNPNPIISLDGDNQVTFANPATRRMLSALGRPANDYGYLLSPKLEQEKARVCASHDGSHRFEYHVDDLILRCQLHWLQDQEQWDLHLVDITAQKQAEKKLQYQAYHHPETGLSNQYELKDHLTRFSEQQNPISISIMQLQGYSGLVSGRGFEAAQLVVNQLASSLQRIGASFKEDKTCLYHTGDDHFVIIMHGTGAVDRILAFIKEIELLLACSVFHCQHQPELRFGIANFPEHGKTPDQLLKNARTAMDSISEYQENNYAVFDHDIGAQKEREQQMVDDIRTAISRNEFILHFQPQVDINANKVIGAEVLVRWPRPEGWVSPGEFIPLAERSGLIVSLGDWILRTACIKAKQIIDAGHTELVMAVNISPRQFSRDDFFHNVKTILDETGLPAANLELEITEGVIMHNEQETIKTLLQLKDLGVQLAIDDFGTGYSSLSYLKRFPIDKLKIDQSFVRQMHQDKDDRSIVRAIIDLGNNLHLKLIAEGVEEQEHWDLLQAMGCDEIQGYFYSRPLAEEQYLGFLSEQAPPQRGISEL